MKKIKIILTTWIASLNLWVAIKKADNAYTDAEIKNNKDKRYYVMPDHNDKLIVMNRSEFRKLKLHKRMSEEAKVKHLIKESFYYTPYSGGADAIDPNIRKLKRIMYIKYCLHSKGLL